jgi:hypothetical protein
MLVGAQYRRLNYRVPLKSFATSRRLLQLSKTRSVASRDADSFQPTNMLTADCIPTSTMPSKPAWSVGHVFRPGTLAHSGS